MPDEWIIRDEDQEIMEQSRRTLIERIRASPRGDDPKVVEILDQMENEYRVNKYYGRVNKYYGPLAKLIPLL